MSRPLLPILVLSAGLLFLGSLLGPASSTETRYAEMGREMLESGDWLVPTLNGAPLLEKPPWVYWVTAASFAVFGVNDVAPRVPPLLAAALAALALAALVRRAARAAGDAPELARDRGRLAALALWTMPAWLVQAYTISTDAWLVLTTTLAGWALLEAERAPAGRARFGWTMLLHGATGLSMLVKGPLALALVALAAVVAAALRRDARVLRPFAHPLGWALFAALTVPWYLALDARIPGTLRAFLERRLFGGVASASDFHHHPVWTVWVPLLGAFPWLATAPASILALRREGRWKGGVGLPVALLALAAPAFFSFSAARLVSYASPSFPWIAALVALGAPAGTASEPEGARGLRSWPTSLRNATFGVAVAAVGSVVAAAVALGVGGAPLATAAALAAATVAVAFLVRAAGSRWPLAPRAALAGALLLATSAAGLVGKPMTAGAAKPLWDAVARIRKPGEELGVALNYNGDWGLFPWYAREPVKYFHYPAAPMLVDPGLWRPDLFLPGDRLQAWFGAPERRFLMTRHRYVRDADGGELGPLPRHVVAEGREYVVLTNLPLPAGP